MQAKQKYNIIFRACDKVNAVNKNPRPFGLTKSQLIKICFLSLVETLKGQRFRIIVLGDNLSEEMISFFKSFDVEMVLGVYGNGGSIRETLKIASAIPDDEWIYFCEDDYLHLPNSFRLIDNFISGQKGVFHQPVKLGNLLSLLNVGDKDLFIFPPDYPDRYSPKYMKHSIVIHSEDCHWRQVTNVTFTFLGKSSSVNKHMSILIRASKGANDKWMSRKLFGRYGVLANSICFSPMPGLSTHMHKDTMTPLIDWEVITQTYQSKL